MSKSFFRAGAGLALALALAALTSPALGVPGGPADGDRVEAAAAAEATDVRPVGGSGGPAAAPILTQLAERVAADLAAAEHAAALERLAAAEEAAKLERLAAAEEAAKLERLAAAIEAQARQAEQARAAAAPAPSAPAGSVEAIIQHHFGSAAGKAIAVARCESGLNPRAVSPGGGNHGLFQINNVHRGTFESVTGQPWSAVYDADTNTRFARWLYGQQGWGPWACA